MDFLVGRSLGPYELQNRLGAGGMGLVYRGLHRRLGQYRALKVLPPHLAEDPDLVERFEREARLAANLHHPNIVPLYDVGEENGLHYLVMELLVGRSLRQVLTEDRPLEAGRALGLLRQLAAALDYAHGRGVIHRDVKPANVFVSPSDSSEEHVSLVDFGIALAGQESRLTGAGQVVGTAEYLAPEMVTGQEIGPAADLYALGIIAYEMLTGRVPFTGTNTHAIMMAQAANAPPPPQTFRADMPAMVQTVILRQLEKRPEHRFRTASAFVSALANASSGWEPGAAFEPPSVAAPDRRADPPTPRPGRPSNHRQRPPAAPDAGRHPPSTAPAWPPARESDPLARPHEQDAPPQSYAPTPPGWPGPADGGNLGSGYGPPPTPAATPPPRRDSMGKWVVVIGLLGIVALVIVGAVVSVGIGGRQSTVAEAVLGPQPTATVRAATTPAPVATRAPTAATAPASTAGAAGAPKVTTAPAVTPAPAASAPQASPAATPAVPASDLRLNDVPGTWVSVSSTRNASPATPEPSEKITVTASGDRALMMVPETRANNPLRFELDRAEGQTLVGTAYSGYEEADATLAMSQDRRQFTLTIRPRPGASQAGDTLTLTLRRT